MFRNPQAIFLATKTVLKNQVYRILFLPIFAAVLVFFVAIPIIAIPSNTLQLQFSLYNPIDYITLVALAMFGSIFVLMNIYVYKQAKEKRLSVVAKGGIGGAFGTLASVFGAASCPMCVAALFGFLGFGTVGILVQYQLWVFLAALFFMLFSLHFISRKVSGVCEKC